LARDQWRCREEVRTRSQASPDGRGDPRRRFRLTGEQFDHGNYVAPTIAKLPLNSSLFREELFVPFLAIGEVAGLDQAIAETNKTDYGLTAGIFSQRDADIARFFDEVEAGCAT